MHFFGTVGANNDINVLNRSNLFTQVLQGRAPEVEFMVNGTEYNMGYYLADGIYPEWATFVKTIPLPQCDKDKLFAAHQEGARKDVERAFGVCKLALPFYVTQHICGKCDHFVTSCMHVLYCIK
jgi:hypothetical protein